jgi:L,D-transpeptidase catalytic domain
MRPQEILSAWLFAAGLTSTFASGAFANVAISVDKTTQHMTVSVDGSTRYVWPVSTGRPGYDTPDGTFRPSWMSAMHYSKEYENAPMPDSIFFVKGDAIHGFTDTPFGVAAVSHGCVRLPRADAAVLFQLVKEEGMANTSIAVQGHIPQRPLVAQRGMPMQQAESEQPISPGYAQEDYGPPAYGRSAYDQYGRPAFAQQTPPAYYGEPAYYDGGAEQPSYGGYYGRSYSPF